MQNVILGLHSLIRWLVIIAALATIVKLSLNLTRKAEFDGASRGLVAAFSGLMDLQVLLGLIYFVWNGLAMGQLFSFGTPIIRQRWEHLFVMVIALVVAHLPARWKDKPDQLRTRNTLIAVLGSLLLVGLGVSMLGAGRWAFHWPF